MSCRVGFLVIGAPKAGTTSLFEYLRLHPQIHMPPEKEIYFFNMDRNFRRGLEWYLSTVARDAPSDAICGEATTEYMSGVPYTELSGNGEPEAVGDETGSIEELIPRRIRSSLPDVRLLCVLRDPVQRARSHHRMMALNNVERRSFEDAVDELIEPSALLETRRIRTRVNGYIVDGEYARLLEGFLRVFPREQLNVILSNELADRPGDVLADVFRFIGVAADFVPPNLGTRFRTAAVKQRIPGMNLVTWQANLARARPIRGAWHALPERVSRRIDRAYNAANYRAEMWNALRGEAPDEIPAEVHDRLAEHYRRDSEALARMLDRDIPWLAAWDARLRLPVR